MKKVFYLTMILSIILIGCSNQQETRELNKEETLVQSEQTKNELQNTNSKAEDIEDEVLEQDTENKQGTTETPEKDDDSQNNEETQRAEEESETTKVTYAVPTFESLPEDAAYEAMVLVNSGAKVHKEPLVDSEAIGNLSFGAHLFAIADLNEMTYVYSKGIEGWVSQSQIKEIPYDSNEKIVVENPDDLLVLVNKTYKLPYDYKPADLSIPNVPFPFTENLAKKHMRAVAAKALEEMFSESQQAGLNLFATSGYRSFATQQWIFPNNVNKVGFTDANQYSAFPGESEHQTGLAMDVTNQEVNFALIERFGDTKEGIWIKDNAHKFGFIIRYPKGKEHITGYVYEPWHLRYVGIEAATEIYELGVTLDEYLEE